MKRDADDALMQLARQFAGAGFSIGHRAELTETQIRRYQELTRRCSQADSLSHEAPQPS
ncbi:hypothetical protein ACFWB1_29625 [Streptomyces goshikiensis]|uniref:hypothetical protein n=1 Tax=Streptomyces goshikiensis TaxID=1942 RepID=UPI0036ABF73A